MQSKGPLSLYVLLVVIASGEHECIVGALRLYHVYKNYTLPCVSVLSLHLHSLLFFPRRSAGKDNSVELQTLAVATLRHLSLDDTLKRGIVQAGTLPVLLRCNANSNNADQQCQVRPVIGIGYLLTGRLIAGSVDSLNAFVFTGCRLVGKSRRKYRQSDQHRGGSFFFQNVPS